MTTMDTATELAGLDATAQADLVRAGDLTAVELVEAAIERIEKLNPTLNAVITPMYEQARAAARTPRPGPFHGVPYLMKDLAADVEGVRFCEGSRFLRDNVATFSSELVNRLRAAGLVIVGKTNTPEFGMSPSCEPALFGATANPWDTTRSTSGSSGGSSAAVASGMVAAAHANDLGGSIRYPASACGLFGLKPTRGRNPIGPEYGDVVSGWPRTPDGELGHPDCVAALEDAASLCEQLGHELVECDVPGLTPEVGGAIGTVFNSATAWILRYWIRHVGREPEQDELEPLTRAYWEMGERVTAGAYLIAIEELQRFSRGVAAFLNDIDVWLTPTMSTPPLPLGEMLSTPEEPLRSMEKSGPTVRYAGVIANMTGNPAMSVPLWWNADGLPIGVHFLGRFGDEATLFRLAAQLETARPWADREPVVTARR